MTRRRVTAATRIDWPAAAQRLAELLPPERLHVSVRRWAKDANGPWTVAFSGGADSLALLLLVWAHWPARRRGLQALHFNHRLRGRAADADERFCRQVCAGLNVPLRTARWMRTERGRPSETEARAARFAFFDRALASARRRILWLGHHQNDLAESILMRLARIGHAAFRRGRPVAVAGLANRIGSVAVRLLPRGLAARIVARLQRSRREDGVRGR